MTMQQEKNPQLIMCGFFYYVMQNVQIQLKRFEQWIHRRSMIGILHSDDPKDEVLEKVNETMGVTVWF